MNLKKIKNTLLVVLTLALVSAASVAITFAYVEANMGTKTNTFTNDNISVELSEVAWDGKKGTNDDASDVPTENEKGETLATSYYAGQVIPKNPKLTNTSDNASEWVAIKAEYTATIKDDANPDGKLYTYYTRKQFEDEIAKLCTGKGVSAAPGINSSWEANTAGTVFYYKTVLESGDSTARLFDSVKINDLEPITDVGSNNGKYAIKTYSSASDSGTTVYATSLPDFNIKLTGYAVQSEGIENLTNAKTALDALME